MVGVISLLRAVTANPIASKSIRIHLFEIKKSKPLRGHLYPCPKTARIFSGLLL